MSLSPDQQAAADQFVDFLLDPTQTVMVLQGSAGTGKSYLTRHLLELAQAQLSLLKTLVDNAQQLNFVITAATNKATSVIADVMQTDAATTIHSFMKLRVRNDYSKGTTHLERTRDFQVKENVLIIVDEASMIGYKLLDIIKESTLNCKVLYIGDPYQLNPVFESSCPVFTEGYPTARLTTVQRQAKDNPIIQLAQNLRKTVETNEFFDLPTDGKHIIHLSGDDFQKEMENSFLNQTHKNDNKVLAWSNNVVRGYNSHIRSLFTQNPAPYKGEILISNSAISGQNGRIILANEEEIEVHRWEENPFSNIAGYDILTTKGENIFMPKNYMEVEQLIKQAQRAKDWHTYFHYKNTVADLRPAYASTVHKSQGSTYKNVFINLTNIGKCNKPNEVARMLYVAVTRASERVIFNGELPKKYRG